jgi:hypothetical protein
VPLMQQELLTLSEHLISPSFFSEVHVALVFSTIDCLFGLFLSAIVYRFLLVLRFTPPIKLTTTIMNITEILLKVALKHHKPNQTIHV